MSDPLRARLDVLYQRAEEACAAGLPLHRALDAVRDGYSSVEFDREQAAEREQPEAPVIEG